MEYKYCVSRKNTNKADKIKPIPMLKTTKHPIGKINNRNFHEKCTPSIPTNAK
jgi:hypothetical protein